MLVRRSSLLILLLALFLPSPGELRAQHTFVFDEVGVLAVAPVLASEQLSELAASLGPITWNILAMQWPSTLPADSISVAAGEDCVDTACLLRAADRSGADFLVMFELIEEKTIPNELVEPQDIARPGEGRAVPLLPPTRRAILRIRGVSDGKLLLIDEVSCRLCDDEQLRSAAITLLAENLLGAPTWEPSLLLFPDELQEVQWPMDRIYSDLVEEQLQIGKVLVAATLIPSPKLGCIGPGESVPMRVEWSAVNLSKRKREVDGRLHILVWDDLNGRLLMDEQHELRRKLGARSESAGLLSDRAEFNVEWRQEAPDVVPLRIEVRWDEQNLVKARTRPISLPVRFVDLWIEQDGDRVDEVIRWDKELDIRVAMLKDRVPDELPVMLRIERRRGNLLGRNVATEIAVPGHLSGQVELQYSFMPDPPEGEREPGLSFEVWVGGCRVHSSDKVY